MTEEILNKAHDYARNNIERTEEGGYDIIEEMRFVNAYLAGAKDNVPQWHKVADGDLPEDNRVVLDEAGDRFYYFRGHFYYENDSRFDCQPIAWCEIPTYSEESK